MADGVPPAVESLIADEAVSAHLATSVDDRPHVAPVWYRYDDGRIEVLTTGRKLRNVRENPKVALSIERSVDGDPEWTATLRGTARIVEDEAVTREANTALNRKYDAEDDAWDGNSLVRIDVASATARRY